MQKKNLHHFSQTQWKGGMLPVEKNHSSSVVFQVTLHRVRIELQLVRWGQVSVCHSVCLTGHLLNRSSFWELWLLGYAFDFELNGTVGPWKMCLLY